MTAPETDLTPLDPRHPIALDPKLREFWKALLTSGNPAFIIEQTLRAAAEAARREERYVTAAPEPRFVPALAHDDTSVDGLPRDWYRDSFPREGMPQPDGTDTFMLGYSQAEAEERAAAERDPLRRARRAIGRLVRGT